MNTDKIYAEQSQTNMPLKYEKQIKLRPISGNPLENRSFCLRLSLQLFCKVYKFKYVFIGVNAV